MRTEEVALEGVDCGTLQVPMTVTNATTCGCVSCDSVPVQIVLTVLALRSRDPIPAAQVFQLGSSSSDDITFLGITDNFGRFSTSGLAREQTLSLEVRAMGYASQAVGAFNLLPSAGRITRDVVLMPNMEVVVGMGGEAFNLRLGSMLSISGSPFTFTDMDGEPYEDAITFQGTVVEIDDEEALDTIPSGDFTYVDEATGNTISFGVFIGMMINFVDVNGMPLQADPSAIQVSISVQSDGEGEMPEVFLVTYDPVTGTFSRGKTLSAVEPLRKKRQNVPPVILQESGEDRGGRGGWKGESEGIRKQVVSTL